jgi:DNA-binding beta-propeller fold protein YncE
VVVDPAGKFVYTPDVGANEVSAFAIQSSGALKSVKGSPFAAGTEPAGIAICRAASGKCIPPAL